VLCIQLLRVVTISVLLAPKIRGLHSHCMHGLLTACWTLNRQSLLSSPCSLPDKMHIARHRALQQGVRAAACKIVAKACMRCKLCNGILRILCFLQRPEAKLAMQGIRATTAMKLRCGHSSGLHGCCCKTLPGMSKHFMIHAKACSHNPTKRQGHMQPHLAHMQKCATPSCLCGSAFPPKLAGKPLGYLRAGEPLLLGDRSEPGGLTLIAASILRGNVLATRASSASLHTRNRHQHTVSTLEPDCCF
jgi:hypothetical protein